MSNSTNNKLKKSQEIPRNPLIVRRALHSGVCKENPHYTILLSDPKYVQDRMEQKRKAVANRDRCISNKDRKRSITTPVTHEVFTTTKHTNYYEVLSDVPCAKDDEFWHHEEISLDQKAIRKCRKADRRISASKKVFKDQFNNKVTRRNRRMKEEPVLSTQANPFTAVLSSHLPRRRPPKPALQQVCESMKAVEVFMKLIPENIRTGADMVFNLYVSLNHLRHATGVNDFITRLYLGMRTIWQGATHTLAVKLWETLKFHYQQLETQGKEDKPARSLWRQTNDGLSKMWSHMEDWFGCPTMDMILDLMSLVSFSGFFGEKAFDFLKEHGFNHWHKRVVEKTQGWPDVFSVCVNVATMVTDAVATYFEDGTLDFFGWTYGRRKDIFKAYSLLMNESTDAIGRRLDDASRPITATFRSQQSYTEELGRVTDALQALTKKGTVHEKSTYNRMYGEMLKIQADMTEFHRSSSSRIKPYTFCVCGVTSSMKSTITQAVWRQIAITNGISAEMTNQATVNFKDKYFSEVKAQEVLVMDDFMNSKPKTEQEGTSPIRVLLDWSSNVAVQIPSAHLEEKGKRYCNAKILGLTCHSKEFHAEAYSYQPEAAYRRVEIFIESHLRSEFKAEDGRPDFKKIPKAFFPDVWDFKLFTVKINGTDWCFDRVGGPDRVFNNQELMTYLSKDSKEHFERQRELSDRVNSNNWFCGHDQVADSCIFCHPIIPTRLGEPERVSKAACLTILAHALPRMSGKKRKEWLAHVWDVVEQLPDQSWATSYLEDLSRIIFQQGDELGNQDLEELDAEYEVRVREFRENEERCQRPETGSERILDHRSVCEFIHTGEISPSVLSGETTLSQEVVDEFIHVGHVTHRTTTIDQQVETTSVLTPEQEMIHIGHVVHRTADENKSVAVTPLSQATTEFINIGHVTHRTRDPCTRSVEDQGELEPLLPVMTEDDIEMTDLSPPPEFSTVQQAAEQGDSEMAELLSIWKRLGELETQAWEDQIEIHRETLTQTTFIVAVDNASDETVQEIVNDVISWLAARHLSARLDTNIFLDGLQIIVTHDEYIDDLLPMGLQAREAAVVAPTKKEYSWFNEEYRLKYPKAEHPEQWVDKMKSVRHSSTVSGWLHTKIADRVEENERTKGPFDWKLCSFMTLYNLCGYGKHIALMFGCFGIGVPLLVTYMIATFCDYKMSRASSPLHFFAMWTGKQARFCFDKAWNVDKTVESWMDGMISKNTRVRWYLDWNPSVKNDLTRRVMVNWKVPTTFDILFGKRKREASVAVKLVAISSGLAALWLLWREFSNLEPVALAENYIDEYRDQVMDLKPTEQSDEGMIKPLPGEQKDCWLKVGPPNVQLSREACTTTPQAFRAMLNKNVTLCEIKYTMDNELRRAGCYAFAVGGSDWIIPSHVLRDTVLDYQFQSRSKETDDTIDEKVIGKFCRSQCIQLGETDFSLVRLKSSAPKKKLIEYFPEGDCSNVYASLFHFEDDQLQETACRRMPQPEKKSVRHNGQTYRDLQVVYQTSYPIKTTIGLCGAPWIANPTSKPFIHSFHICGLEGTNIGGSQIITRGDLTKAIEKLNAETNIQPVCEGKMTPELFGDMEIQAIVNSRHPINFTSPTPNPAYAAIIGSHDGHSGKYCQDIRPTAIAESLTNKLGWEQAFKAVPAPNSTRHLHKGLEEILHPRVMLDAQVLSEATSDLRKHIMDYIRQIPNLKDSVVPLLPVVTVSGQDGVVGVDKMNPSTSAGFPERGAKGRFYVKSPPVPGISDPYVLDDVHMERISKIEAKLAEGERVYAPFTLSVKIEPTKITKEHARLFGASNMCFTFLFRKYFLSIFRLIQLNPYQFGTALGINCHSGDWDSLYNLMKWKDRIIEGDYKTYDKTMSPAIILDVFSILIEIAKEAGYSDRQLKIMNGLAYEVAFPTYEARGLLFVAGGSNPSGHPGTFVINTLVCSLYARYCFFKEAHAQKIYLQNPFSFYVKEITAGDDHLFSVSPECTWFDQHIMQKHLATADIGYTDGKKNSVIPDKFINISDASFVSRGFRYCDYLKRWVGPLAVKSLKKSYMIHNLPQKPPVPLPDLLATIVEQNMVELFFHGEAEFIRMDTAVREAMDEVGLGHLKPPVLSFSQVGDKIKERTIPGFQVDLRTGENLKYHPPDVIIGKVDDPYILEITESS